MDRSPAPILIVPGLRGPVAEHWQTLLERRLAAAQRRVYAVPATGAVPLDCSAKVAAIEQVADAIEEPAIAVAHSGGVIALVHWARTTRHQLKAALLVVPPDFARPMPSGYPSLGDLQEHGWLPVPWHPLPFRSLVVVSSNDPLAAASQVRAMAQAWGSAIHEAGPVGHLNPASGYGDWPLAEALINRLDG